MTTIEQTDETETAAETAVEAPEGAAPPEAEPESQDGPEDAQETFPRKVVEDLRRENAKYRDRAKRADDLGERLHLALVTATGRLADPTDLVFDEAHLDDAEALTAAVDDLLARKPHLATRRVSGDVGQGMSGAADTFDLAGLLRSRT